MGVLEGALWRTIQAYAGRPDPAIRRVVGGGDGQAGLHATARADLTAFFQRFAWAHVILEFGGQSVRASGLAQAAGWNGSSPSRVGWG